MPPGSAQWVAATRAALEPLADSERAGQMAAYMKGVAPFLGISTPDRRRALRGAWEGYPPLDEPALFVAVHALWAEPEREFSYAACDLLARHSRTLTATAVTLLTPELIASRPWWDTIDTLGSVVVTPVVSRNPELVALMWAWLHSGDRWLIRAAIQHQRGLRAETDLPRLLSMCEPFVADREFFIAKAIGWALRDVTAWDAPAVRAFVDAHPDLSPVARREAVRGLDRSTRP